MIDTLLRWWVRIMLWLRYRLHVTGLEEVAARGTGGILFLPNHPALIDPIIMLALLHKRFRPRALADQDQIDRPVIRRLARRMGVRPIPDAARYGAEARPRIEAALAECIEGLRRGENLLLYPSGHIYRQRLEDLRGNTAVDMILRQAPGVRVVLVRQRGLWGSGFSWAGGGPPDVGRTLRRGALALLASGVFFAPRRGVTIELWEPADFPRDADRDRRNRFMADFYNEGAPPNTFVPYSIWDRGGARRMPEPAPPAVAEALHSVPPATRKIVTDHLAELTGLTEFADDHRLAHDLGLDSLARADLVVWLESEFGFPQGDAESLRTVSDVLLAACGQTVAAGPERIAPVPARWPAERAPAAPPVAVPPGLTVPEVFLAQARRGPARVVLADQSAGGRSYRDVVAAVTVLSGEIARLPGEYIGIMLPASAAADILFLAALFARKTPVMVNWTVGPRNVAHALETVGVARVLTAEALVARLAAAGTDLSAVADRFVFLERLARGLSRLRKLRGWLDSRLSWPDPPPAGEGDTAAVLFTSGSESLPKAVPLTHANLLANIRDVLSVISLRPDDRLLGILPPFHSFGLTATTLLPLCAGVPVVHHPNPTEGVMLARLIEAYGVTAVIGTPTFLAGIARAAGPGQCRSLRLAVTGAEKCPRRVYQAISAACPGAAVLEGYGVTECSPIVSVNREDEVRPETIGRPLPSVEHAVVDLDTGRRAGPGAAGMLLVRGPSVFGGYLHHDGPSPFVDFEGRQWYRTGDLVRQDAGGVLTFAGRLKRFIKLGGEMISLPAIESALTARWGGEADEAPTLAVEATPSEEHPEVVLFTTRDIDRAAANLAIRQAGLSPLHNVRRVIRLDAIPTLGTGKTDYRALKRLLVEDGPERND